MSTTEDSALPDSIEKWYSEGSPNLRPETRDVLEKYSQIPPDEVIPHVQAIRDKGWSVHKYPCIGQWRFLDLSLGFHKLYPEILSRMRSGNAIYLDLGCAFAQDIRRLVADGVDSSKCYGSDLRLDFIELGYELFKDKDTLKSKFIAADVFDTSSPLREIDGTIDIIGASSFFHLFTWDEQKTVALRVARLMKPQKGSLLVGRQVGHDEPGVFPGASGRGSRYRHNVASWRSLWNEVGSEVGAQFEVEGETERVDAEHVPAGYTMMSFSVRRL